MECGAAVADSLDDRCEKGRVLARVELAGIDRDHVAVPQPETPLEPDPVAPPGGEKRMVETAADYDFMMTARIAQPGLADKRTDDCGH